MATFFKLVDKSDRVRIVGAVSFVLLLLGVQRTLGQTICIAPNGVLTSDADISLISTKPGDCQQIVGDLVFGHQDCSTTCTLTSLATLNNVHTISGSITIQCCHSLTTLNLFPSVRSFTGNLLIYYNRELNSFSGFDQLQTMEGSITISQNPKLMQIDGFNLLQTITGYLAIQYNPMLNRLTGISRVSTIEGQQLLSGHALVITHDINLASLADLSSLQTISYGTVHIEGNTALCYAGYPTWSVGSYASRLDDTTSGIDRGIDWRSKFSSSEMWQYTWDIDGGGYPTLFISDNGQDCESASCDSSCPMNAGCLGPNDGNLCGSCVIIGTIDTCASRMTTNPGHTEPAGGGGGNTGIIVGVVVVILVVIIVAVVLVIVLLVVFGKKCRQGKSGSFDINNFSSEEEGLTTTQASDLIASSNDTQNKFGKKSNRQDMNNIVMISRNSDQYQEPNVIYNKNATSNSSPQVTLRDKVQNKESKPTSSTENLPSTQDEETTGNDWPDMGKEETEFIPADESFPTESAKKETLLNRMSSTVDIERLKQGSSEINISFPKEQVKLGKQIGIGDFGKVLQAEARKLIPGQKKTSVVVKQLKLNATKEEKDDFLRPVEAMKLLKHENVLSLMGVVSTGPNILVMLEDCPLGNFKTFLVSKRRESKSIKDNGQLLKMSKDLAAGLGYLHSMTVAHNDLAARNCLVAKDGTIKLGDYGISRQLFKEDYYSRTPGNKAWPIRWMAPEQVIYQDRNVLDSHPVSMAANIWSLGVALWEVCSFAQWPYDEMSNEEVIQMVIRTGKCSLECPFDAGEKLVFLYACCQLCWQDEGNRPTIEEIITMLKEPSTISNKRRKSSLTRQHHIVPQSRSKTLSASGIPATTTNRNSQGPINSEIAIVQRVPLSDTKPTMPNGASITSEKSATPTRSMTVTNPATSPNSTLTSKDQGNSNKSTPSDDTIVSPKSQSASQENNTGTLRKPKRPAPVKPAPKVPPSKQKDSTSSSTEAVEKSFSSGPNRRPAPIRSAPSHPKTAPTNRDSTLTHSPHYQEERASRKENADTTISKTARSENGKSEGSNKIKRVHSYRSNRKANEVVKSLQTDKAKKNAHEETKKPSPKIAPSLKHSVPSAQNFGFAQTELEVKDKSEDALHDSFESDMDETYFLGGAESLPQEDFILDPPEHFSESSIGELEEVQPEVPANVKNVISKSHAQEPVIHNDQGGMTMQFKPPQVSDDDVDTKTPDEIQNEVKEVAKEMKPKTSSKDEEDFRAKKVRKKKKKRASRDLTDEEDSLRRERRKKKKAAKQLKINEDEQEDLEEMIPEYLHDRGMDRVPMKSSQDLPANFARPPMRTSQDVFTNSIASYRSNESLDSAGIVKKRHKSYYGDVKATDEFTPPWLEDDPNEEKDDDDPYLGDDAPPNVVYDEEVSSLLW